MQIHFSRLRMMLSLFSSVYNVASVFALFEICYNFHQRGMLSKGRISYQFFLRLIGVWYKSQNQKLPIPNYCQKCRLRFVTSLFGFGHGASHVVNNNNSTNKCFVCRTLDVVSFEKDVVIKVLFGYLIKSNFLLFQFAFYLI